MRCAVVGINAFSAGLNLALAISTGWGNLNWINMVVFAVCLFVAILVGTEQANAGAR